MEATGQYKVPATLLPGKKLSIPFGWALELVWVQWRGEKKTLTLVGNLNLVVQPVA
jgi:hypothetical protein